MSNPKFQAGDRVDNIKNKRVGFIKKLRREGVYLVSVQGLGEREWNEADIVKAEEPKTKFSQKYNRSA